VGEGANKPFTLEFRRPAAQLEVVSPAFGASASNSDRQHLGRRIVAFREVVLLPNLCWNARGVPANTARTDSFIDLKRVLNEADGTAKNCTGRSIVSVFKRAAQWTKKGIAPIAGLQRHRLISSRLEGQLARASEMNPARRRDARRDRAFRTFRGTRRSWT